LSSATVAEVIDEEVTKDEEDEEEEEEEVVVIEGDEEEEEATADNVVDSAAVDAPVDVSIGGGREDDCVCSDRSPSRSRWREDVTGPCSTDADAAAEVGALGFLRTGGEAPSPGSGARVETLSRMGLFLPDMVKCTGGGRAEAVERSSLNRGSKCQKRGGSVESGEGLPKRSHTGRTVQYCIYRTKHPQYGKVL